MDQDIAIEGQNFVVHPPFHQSVAWNPENYISISALDEILLNNLSGCPQIQGLGLGLLETLEKRCVKNQIQPMRTPWYSLFYSWPITDQKPFDSFIPSLVSSAKEFATVWHWLYVAPCEHANYQDNFFQDNHLCLQFWLRLVRILILEGLM